MKLVDGKIPVLLVAQVFLLNLSSLSVQANPTLDGLNVYVWDFTTHDFKNNKLTNQMTELFESQLVNNVGCFAGILQRRDISYLLFHKQQEQEITNELWGISENATTQLKKYSANAVVFGRIHSSKDTLDALLSGEVSPKNISLDVTVQAFGSTKILAKQMVNLKFDTHFRDMLESKMRELAENLCSSPNLWYEKSGKIIKDRKRRLMWLNKVEFLTWDKAEQYCKTTNQKRIAGYRDWRLASTSDLQELAKIAGVTGDHGWFWSTLKASVLKNPRYRKAWLVYVGREYVKLANVKEKHYVRLVRSF